MSFLTPPRNENQYQLSYRPEIDGLRTIAVVSVLLFHAGLSFLSGGFVGVDVFFVISGYLITTIILKDLANGTFSLLRFYERRFRRILPALYAVMVFVLVGGYFLLLPDEYKNVGQSVFATTIYANNILLGITSGYWDLASHFKPLLHTWSLGVEEQYYAIVPMLLMLAWRFLRKYIFQAILLCIVASLSLSVWMSSAYPIWSFYLLPTRFWELAIGAACAYALFHDGIAIDNQKRNNFLSLVGIVMIAASAVFLDNEILASTAFPLLVIPTVGACLIVVYAREGTVAHALLSQKTMVYIGLISYSLYLWHQPVYAFIRVWFKDQPPEYYFLLSLPFVFILSHISWKYIEQPFRDRKRFTQKTIFGLTAVTSVIFCAIGLMLNSNYGMFSRLYDSSISIADMDKRSYNSKIFKFKTDAFPENGKPNLLVLGNSFGRDFVNMVLETHDTSGINIVYRDDLDECTGFDNGVGKDLFAKADIVVFASHTGKCAREHIANKPNGEVFYLGTKFFGWNENWIIRLPKNQHPNQKNDIAAFGLFEKDAEVRIRMPERNFVSLLEPIVDGTMIPVTDENGILISTDRAHVTKYGAIYFGKKVIKPSRLGEVLGKATATK